MTLDVTTRCYWEEAQWPLVLANTAPPEGEKREIAAAHFEDIRKRIYVIENPNIGNVALSYLFTAANWVGSWDAYAPPDIADPGDITVRYQDAEGNIDYYINRIAMSEGTLDSRPPLRPDGQLDSSWRLAPDPNRYHSWDHNAGKPSAGAVGRWRVIYHGPSDGCGHLEYVSETPAYKWLPRQVDPYRQVAPLKYADGRVERRHQSVEFQKDFICRYIGPTHERSLNTGPYEPCLNPRRLTEYVYEFGEPSWTGETDEECGLSNQCHMDAKMNAAYQDRVIRTAEEQGFRFLKEVDETWVENWLSVQTKYLWEDAEYYTAGKIVYKVAETDAVLYVCYTGHTATPDREPGVGVDWEDYFVTPAYNPTYVRSQPVYVAMNGSENTTPQQSYTWLWGCNDSAYELLLKSLGGIESVYPAWSADHGAYIVDDVVRHGDICRRCKVTHDSDETRDPTNGEYWEAVTQFDWWWDTTYPGVPLWLYMYQYDESPVDWPLPRGCWRRMGKHSPGRLGSLMWPGEKGDPPGYQGLKLIVSQAAYLAMPEGHRKWYAVSDVEGLHAAAYGDIEEALIAKRHDPTHIRWIEYFDEDLGEMAWAGHSIYEMHHDLVNDMRNCLLQLYRVEADGLDITAKYNQFQCVDGLTADTSLAAYTQARVSAMNNLSVWTVGFGWFRYGYLVEIELWDPLGTPQYFSSGEGGVLMIDFFVEITKQQGASQALDISSTILRVAYKGSDEGASSANEHVFDGATFGIGDLTVYAAPDDETERNCYVRLALGADSTAETWFFEGELLDPWPATEPDEFFDFDELGTFYSKEWRRRIYLVIDGYGMDKWAVMEYDWDMIPEDVWAEDSANIIEVA